MSEEGGYDVKPVEKPPASASPAGGQPNPSGPLKPGDPGWIPPTVIIEKEVPASGDSDEPPKDPDIEKNKGIAILGYICFIIPLVAAPNSKFARYHANQALLNAIFLVVVIIGITILNLVWFQADRFVTITVLNWFFGCGVHIISFLLLAGWVALTIAGIIHAANGEKKPLPILGHWTLIK